MRTKINVWMVAVLTAGSLALTLAACSGPGGSDVGDGSPAAGGDLKVAVADLPPGKGNPFTVIAIPGIYVWAPIFDGLTVIAEDGSLQPGLATEWANEDEKNWVFTLREGVKFSNGEELDAAAVASTINYLKSDPEGMTTIVSTNLIPTVESATVIDAVTVRITTNAPDPILPNRMSQTFIVPPKYFDEVGAAEFGNKPIGTGSFKVKSWSANEVNLERNLTSWRQAKVDTLKIVQIADPTARVQALISGQVNVALALSPDQVAAVEAGGSVVDVSPSPVVLAFAYVTEREGSPFKDVRVRQALNYGVDKQAIADGLYGGLTKPIGQSATASTFGYDPAVEAFPYDPAKAKQLLTAAGYPDGFDLTMEMVSGNEIWDQQAQAVKSDLAKVGVNLTVQTLPFSDWLNKFVGVTWEGAMFDIGFYNDPLMDAIRPYANFSCAKSPAYYCDEAAMPLIKKATGAFDRDERRAALQDLIKHSHADPAALYLVEGIDLTGVNGIDGFANINRVLSYDNVTMSAGK